jgi:hypothetical protein
MNTGWITDRLPTAEDAVAYCVLVWDDNGIGIWSCDAVKEGQPWMPINRPEPYVKPKRWMVSRNFDEWCLIDGTKPNYIHYLPKIGQDLKAVARICDIYNETMP